MNSKFAMYIVGCFLVGLTSNNIIGSLIAIVCFAYAVSE